MGTVDVTQRLDDVQRRILDWDFPGARDAVQALLDEPGLGDDDRLTARRLLAEVLREQGDLGAAYDLAEAVAAQAERRYGPSDAHTVHAVAVLAAVRHDYDEWDEAERLYHRVLDSGFDEDGPEPVLRAVRLARVNLALLQRDRGETAPALRMLNAAYLIHRREYGAEDLDTIRIAAELAALQHAEGDVPAARRLFTLAHAAARARLGTRHPFTKAVEWELAAVEPPMPSAPVTAPPAPVVDPVVPMVPIPVVATVPVVSVVPERAPAVADVEDLVFPVAEELVDPQPSPPRRARSAWPLASVVVVLLAASVLAVVFLSRHGGPAASSASAAPPLGVTPSVAVVPSSVTTPPATSSAPAEVRDLRLQDGRTRLTVSWTPLPVTVVVALSRAGAPPVVVTSLPPGTGEYVIRNIAPGVPYCVIVGPLAEAVSVTAATSVCTGDR